MITIKKGLDLPIKGAPKQLISRTQYTERIALLGSDYIDVRPKFQVKVGDSVVKGSPLFIDKKRPEIVFTSPASGVVKDIVRGERRVFLGIVIEIQGQEEKLFEPMDLNTVSREDLVSRLLEGGLWPAFRTRPFSKIPNSDAVPDAIFVNLMDTNPLAADQMVVLQGQEAFFQLGVEALSKLTSKVFVVSNPDAQLPDLSYIPAVELASFSGPHPAGLVGTHIHFLNPVSINRTVWHIDPQDVVSMGHLIKTGQIFTDRVLSFAGPGVIEPTLIKTSLGADVVALSKDHLDSEGHRIVSGSILHGRTADEVLPFLGRYHRQISVLHEDDKQRFMGWLSTKNTTHTITRTTIGSLKIGRLLDFTTSTHGSPRSMVPLGGFELVMPLDILATPLLRDLLSYDTDEAQELGCLELDEEDLALCTYVCQGKYDYGRYLRECLTIIEKEG